MENETRRCYANFNKSTFYCGSGFLLCGWRKTKHIRWQNNNSKQTKQTLIENNNNIEQPEIGIGDRLVVKFFTSFSTIIIIIIGRLAKLWSISDFKWKYYNLKTKTTRSVIIFHFICVIYFNKLWCFDTFDETISTKKKQWEEEKFPKNISFDRIPNFFSFLIGWLVIIDHSSYSAYINISDR